MTSPQEPHEPQAADQPEPTEPPKAEVVDSSSDVPANESLDRSTSDSGNSAQGVNDGANPPGSDSANKSEHSTAGLSDSGAELPPTPQTTEGESNPETRKTSLNHLVFWPPFLLLLAAIGLNFLGKDYVDAAGQTQVGAFSIAVKTAKDWVLLNFGPLFNLCALLSVGLAILICFSKFRHVRLGGPDAKPLMSKWNWFSITICTTIAIGILFWSTAEPIKHMISPPDGAGAANSGEAATFALSTMYLHWSFTPYAIYCVASLAFGFAYYNLKQPFSLGSTLYPLFGKWSYGPLGTVIDAVCLYALVAGMASALGTGILMLGSGLELLTSGSQVFQVTSNTYVWLAIATLIVATFIVSSATGLMKGIRILSDINTKLLFALALVPILFGASWAIAGAAGPALWHYVTTFVPRHFTLIPDAWALDWTVFYWAVWLAWAPITACFLGRIAYGRTVAEFMQINFLLPSLFAIVWMTIFSGTAIDMQLRFIEDPTQALAVNLGSIATTDGEAAVSFAVFQQLPWHILLIVFYMFSAFVCFVTSSDSNMSAMASISSTGITPENPEGNIWLKIIWGTTVGLIAWIMISFTGGVGGVKILSTLGGFPAAFLQLLIIAALGKIVWQHQFATE